MRKDSSESLMEHLTSKLKRRWNSLTLKLSKKGKTKLNIETTGMKLCEQRVSLPKCEFAHALSNSQESLCLPWAVLEVSDVPRTNKKDVATNNTERRMQSLIGSILTTQEELFECYGHVLWCFFFVAVQFTVALEAETGSWVGWLAYFNGITKNANLFQPIKQIKKQLFYQLSHIYFFLVASGGL